MDDEEMSLNNGGPSRLIRVETASNGDLVPDAPMSKSAAKKAAKKAYREATKAEFRAHERAKRKEKKSAVMQDFRAGTLDEEERAKVERRIELSRLKRRQKAGADLDQGMAWKGGVVIDLGFDDLMTDREVSSLAQQLSYVYASNRTAARPFSAILYTSVSPTASPQLWPNVVQRGCAAWHRCFWWAENMDDLAKAFGVEKPSRSRSRTRSISPPPSPLGVQGGFGIKRSLHTSESDPLRDGGALTTAEAAATPSQPPTDITLGQPMNDPGIDNSLSAGAAGSSSTVRASKLETALSGPNLPPAWSNDSHRLVYLSADADEELRTLSEDEVYILGGLVDKNRYKMLCEKKARSLGIRTARLPIGSYIADLPTRKVLTVNQTFDILVKYVELNDWAKAFHAVIPQRKFAAVGKRAVLKQRSQVAQPANLGTEAADEELERGVNA